MSFADHFSAVARDYARFRPAYPDALFDWLAEIAPDRDAALDVATGNSQAAASLARRFARVVALDASAAQITAAPQIAGVELGVAPAEATGLPAASFALVTVAQALHWLDRPRFYVEARRVLRPAGVVAAWGYARLELDEPALTAIVEEFYTEIVGPYWPPGRELVDSRFRTLEWPFAEITPPAFAMRATQDLAALVGYVGTWSATHRFRSVRGFDPLPSLADRLRRLWGDGTREVRWPLFLRVGRV